MAEKKTDKPEENELDIKSLSLKEKIARIMGQIDPINKTKRPGDTVSFKYRSIDDVTNALNPLLVYYKVTLQSVITRCDVHPIEFDKQTGDKVVKKRAYYAVVGIKYILSDDSGKEEYWEEVNMSEDYSDKAVTQASSMCYKYFMTRKFAIITDDMPDGDSRNPDRDVEHDEERSGPRPTKWLNEGTPEWDEHIANPINAGTSPEKVLSAAKAKFKTNKRQDEAILAMKPVKGNAPVAQKEEQKEVKKETAANPPVENKPKGKPKLTAEDKEAWQNQVNEYEHSKTLVANQFKKGAVSDTLRVYNNNVKALREGKVKLEAVLSVYDLDEVVLEHYKVGIFKK